MSLKKILFITTGGTIACVRTPQGLRPVLSSGELLAHLPGLAELCQPDTLALCSIDSTDMSPAHWLDMARAIEENYDRYDGFILCHGTDTLAYTAAALSYLVQNAAKPIILTGSQQPMANPFTDAKLNLYHSVLYACDPASRDVSVVFGGKVICGTRARKQRTMSFNAFTSMNYPSLAYVRGSRIVRPAGAPGSEKSGARPCFYDSLDERVIVLKLTPELQPSIFELLARDYDAVILETFGIGGIPSYEGAYQRAIYDWVESGHTLVVTTQVPEEGLDLGVYEVGHAYAQKDGILRGDDMTTEALVAKTMWALGQTRDPAEVARLFYESVNHDRTPR